jgi:hypothetical protein
VKSRAGAVAGRVVFAKTLEPAIADSLDLMERLTRHGVLHAWHLQEDAHLLVNATNLHPYEPGSWGPHEADRLAIDLGNWHDPEERKESTAPAPRDA